MRSSLLILLISVALFSGCLTDKEQAIPEPIQETFPGVQFQGAATQGQPGGGSPSSHGEPKRTETPVTTGTNPTQPFSAYAKKTVTILNDFGGASLGLVTLGISAGSIEVLPGGPENYHLEIVLEARSQTEMMARDAVDRISVQHEDRLENDGLHLSTIIHYQPMQNPTPIPIFVGGGVQTSSKVVMTVPAGPAYDLWASASSGLVSVSDLRGPRFRLDTSSADVTATGLNAGEVAVTASSGDLVLTTLVADKLSADTSSGSIAGTALLVAEGAFSSSSGTIDVAGRFADLRASSSSGDVRVAAEPTKSGKINMDASSGQLKLELVTAAVLGYDIQADTASGDVMIDLNGTEVLEEGEDGKSKRVQTLGIESLAIQTTVKLLTSSGDIQVQAAEIESGTP